MPSDYAIYEQAYRWQVAYFSVAAFVLGAVVGSFLNVCIYRMPLGLSVNEPRRSFCPNCRAQIPWYHNLPILSWLWLRGRCASCRQPIAVGYPLVELLTAVLFFLIWRQFHEQWILVGPYWLFTALMIVATFIDFDHFIIPDEITIGGTVAGVLLSLAIPQLMHADAHWLGLIWSLIGAAVGYGTLRLVVEAGKLAFGRKRVVLDQAEAFTWTRRPDATDAEMVIAGETELWSEYFNPDRPSDKLVLHCDELTLAGRRHANVVLQCFWDHLILDKTTYRLEKVDTFSGKLREFVFPREAMGLGDVKFIATIGAFLGWQAVFFTIAAASLVGSVVGLTVMVLGPKARSLRLPFGPYLALGAMLWVFAGPALVGWYLGLISR